MLNFKMVRNYGLQDALVLPPSLRSLFLIFRGQRGWFLKPAHVFALHEQSVVTVGCQAREEGQIASSQQKRLNEKYQVDQKRQVKDFTNSGNE